MWVFLKMVRCGICQVYRERKRMNCFEQSQNISSVFPRVGVSSVLLINFTSHMAIYGTLWWTNISMEYHYVSRVNQQTKRPFSISQTVTNYRRMYPKSAWVLNCISELSEVPRNILDQPTIQRYLRQEHHPSWLEAWEHLAEQGHPREGIPGKITDCKRQRVMLMMCTGD